MSKRIVVVGGGVGGLSAAINARLHGYDVLLLEAHRLGGKAAGLEIGGYRLDPGPSIVILPEIYRDLFRRAGVDLDDRLRFHRLDPVSRVYFEGLHGPIDLPAERRACIETIGRVAPGDKGAFERLFGRLDKVAPHIESTIFRRPFHEKWQLADPHLMAVAARFGGGQSYKAVVDRMFGSPLLRAFFYGFPSYGGQTYSGRAWGAFLIPYYMIERGVFYPEGGVASIPRAMADLGREIGVEIREECRVAGLEASDGMVRGVRLCTGEIEAADAVISNVDRTTTRSWLGIRSSATPSFSYFTVHWGIRKVLPGLGHHTLLVPGSFAQGFEELYGRHRMPDEPIVYLNVTGATDPGTAPPGRTNLLAVVTSPACEDGVDWSLFAAEARSRVLGMLARFGWKIGESDFDFERVQTPEYFWSRHGNFRGSLYGIDEKERLFGMFPERCLDEEFKNLFYCGASVQPGAGLPMVTLSGRFAADLAHKRLK